MSRIWQTKKESLGEEAAQFHKQSPAVDLVQSDDSGDEWRAMFLLKTATLAKRLDGTICPAGPILLGVRYHKSFLAEAPHPWEIVTVLEPRGVFHPNCNPAGAICLGHPQAGLSLDFILNQAWFGLTFNMQKVNTVNGDILNPDAARFVRANAERLPLTKKGIFEEPDFKGPTELPFMFGQVPG